MNLVFTSKFVGTRPSSYEKRIYWAAVLQRLRNTGLGDNVGKHGTTCPATNDNIIQQKKM